MGNTLSWPVLPQADAGSTTLIRVDEPDAGFLQSASQGRKDSPAGLGRAPLKLAKSHHTDLGRPGQIILGPVEQGSGSTALGWSHSDCIARLSFFVSSIFFLLAKLLANSPVPGAAILPASRNGLRPVGRSWSGLPRRLRRRSSASLLSPRRAISLQK
jgi:hypothetical protein